MNFDFGEVLSRAFQITWKHKVLWLFSALPVLLSFLIFPIMFVPVFFMDSNPYNQPFFVDQPIYIVLFVGFSILISLVSYVLYGISSSSVMVGVVQVEGGAENLQARQLFEDGRPYWVRVLGVLLLIGLGVSVVFAVFFGCMAAIGTVTMGLGFICMQPLMLLLYPLMLVLYGVIEESQVAVIVDGLGVTDAIRRGWELVRANFWRITLISLIVYLGIGFLSSIVMLPLDVSVLFNSGSDGQWAISDQSPNNDVIHGRVQPYLPAHHGFDTGHHDHLFKNDVYTRLSAFDQIAG